VASLDFVKEKNELLTLSLSGAIACYKFDKYRINKYIQNKVTQCAKNDASFVRNSEKVGTQSQWPCFLAHPVDIFFYQNWKRCIFFTPTQGKITKNIITVFKSVKQFLVFVDRF